MTIKLHDIEVKEPTKAIICMGIPSESNPRFGTYFECVLDPNMASPGGEMLRFDQQQQRGEVHGWQRVADLTVIELLGAAQDYKTPEGCTVEPGAILTIRAVKSWAA